MRRSQALVSRFAFVVGIACALVSSTTWAETVAVAPGESIQSAITAATDGDIIELAAGRYDGDLDFLGKAITVRGVGFRSVIRGSGNGSVVRFATGEDEESVLDSVTLRGGRAERGGGVFIDGASPVVIRCVITRNRARSQGSAVFVTGASQALLYNNVITRNRRAGRGDPHGIEVIDAAPSIVNNTITRGDSNGMLLRGDAPAFVLNNVIAWNGSRVGRDLRGRGICDFSGGRATIAHNLFHRNRVAAMLRRGVDSRRIERLQISSPDPLLFGNVDGNPAARRVRGADGRRGGPHDFVLRSRSRALGTGTSDESCNNVDGSRSDIGHTGGPFRARQLMAGEPAVPTRDSCGAAAPE